MPSNISLDESRSDNYGRQIERQSSCSRMTKDRPVNGNSWHYAEEKGNLPTAHEMAPQYYPAP